MTKIHLEAMVTRREHREPATMAAYVLCLLLLSSSSITQASQFSNLVNRARRTINLSRTFGSATRAPSYERIASQPVFQVTTPWGSPYMVFEQAEKEEDDSPAADGKNIYDVDALASGSGEKDSGMDVRPIALYFMDERDAHALRDEMKSMSNMVDADLRITSTSLAKAVRQSANLGAGLPTGQPVDPLTGDMKAMEDGGSLRYKIMPSKRELFYAARCQGRERIGLGFGKRPEEDAYNMLKPNGMLGAEKAMNRMKLKEEAKKAKKPTAGVPLTQDEILQQQYLHMKGGFGIPVFYCPELKRQPPKIKRLLFRENKMESPLFFSYDDLLDAWTEMKKKSSNPSSIPNRPQIEVYNMFDVVSSLDKDQWKVKRNEELAHKADGFVGSIPVVNSIVRKIKGLKEEKAISSGLEQVTFVPSSRNVEIKVAMSTIGNGKARIRNMR
mmetsp:Transcript_39573/g.59453  ORF Transcript_39573/g.59453 Transcript_39573/m.59453 type:complete len:443 (-) Transcript_39573:405-1733(-)